jgi:hypothetical protein
MVGYLLFFILLKIVRWFVLNFQSFYQQAMVYKTLYRTLKIEQHELLRSPSTICNDIFLVSKSLAFNVLVVVLFYSICTL